MLSKQNAEAFLPFAYETISGISTRAQITPQINKF